MYLCSATVLFRSYYSIYGLLQLGSNVLINCTIIFNLQTMRLDYAGLIILFTSTSQVLFVSLIGQLLQDEAVAYGDALYEVDWLAMSPENKKRVLLLMIGSNRNVNIRAGYIAELNLGLFVRVRQSVINLLKLIFVFYISGC